MKYFENKRILVTGAAGFIGHKLVRALNDSGNSCEIHVTDLFNTHVNKVGDDFALGDFRNLNDIKFDKIFIGDLADSVFLRDLLKNKYDIIFHQGAISDTSYPNQRRLLSVNLESFQFFLDWLRETNGVLVYASSAAVYGNQTGSLELGSEKPINPYGFSKCAMDILTERYIAARNPGTVIGLRYFNVYGPGEQFKYNTASVAGQLATKILSGGTPTLFEDSSSTFRDFVYIDDVTNANLLAAERGQSGVYNVGSGVAKSFLDVFLNLQEILNYQGPVNWIENYVQAYQKYTKAELHRTKQYLEYSPCFNLRAGLNDYVKMLKADCG